MIEFLKDIISWQAFKAKAFLFILAGIFLVIALNLGFQLAHSTYTMIPALAFASYKPKPKVECEYCGKGIANPTYFSIKNGKQVLFCDLKCSERYDDVKSRRGFITKSMIAGGAGIALASGFGGFLGGERFASASGGVPNPPLSVDSGYGGVQSYEALVFLDSSGNNYVKDGITGQLLVSKGIITAWGASQGAGIVGNATTTAGIQEAVTYAHNQGGYVTIASGIFTSTATVVCYSGVDIRGQGRSTQINWNGVFVLFSNNNGSNFQTVANCTLRDFFCNNTNPTVSANSAINIGSSSNVPSHVKIIHVESNGASLEFNYASYCEIINCYVHDILLSTVDRGIGGDSCDHCKIIVCIVYNVPQFGIGGSNSYGTISGNYVVKTGQSGVGFGIDMGSSEYFTTIGNVLDSCGAGGINSENSIGHVNIKLNTIISPTGNGIQVWQNGASGTSPVDVNILGNDIYNASAIGIYCSDVTSGTIADNHCYITGSAGIAIAVSNIANPKNINVHDNFVFASATTSAYQPAISLGSDYIQCHDNMVDGNNVANNGRGIAYNNSIPNSEIYNNKVVNTQNSAYLNATNNNSTPPTSAKRFDHNIPINPVAIFSVTSGASPYTFPLLPYNAVYVLTTIGGMSALTLDGQALFNATFSIGQQVYVAANHTLTATWATTAPVFAILPI